MSYTRGRCEREDDNNRSEKIITQYNATLLRGRSEERNDKGSNTGTEECARTRSGTKRIVVDGREKKTCVQQQSAENSSRSPRNNDNNDNNECTGAMYPLHNELSSSPAGLVVQSRGGKPR